MGAALVCVPRDLCPDCGQETATLRFTQPPLFIGCDYGHALASAIRHCQRCGWFLVESETSVSPRLRDA